MPIGWWSLLVGSVVLLPVLAFITFGLWFAPGWANGWCFSRHVVWSTGVAILLFVTLMTGAVAAGATYAIFRFHDRSVGRTRMAFAVWVASCAAVATLLCVCAGHAFHQGIARAWP